MDAKWGILQRYRPLKPINAGHSFGSLVSEPQSAGMPSGSRYLLPQNPNQDGCDNLQVLVRDNNVDQALRALKKKLQREGVFREMKLRNFYEKPSERRAREKAEAIRRTRKLARKKAQREGLIVGRHGR